MKQTNKQLKRQKKKLYKQQKKIDRQQTIKDIRSLLDQKEKFIDNTTENQIVLDEIWQTLKKLDKMSNKDLKKLREGLENEIRDEKS
jgi:outer membrane PBP1 activator LpoA protein